jgi:glycosyltransferase involved in cell wall biosynthesis
MDLSILIPARNEEFLARTIQDILENSEGNTEIIAILDGYLPDPPLKPDPRITIIYNPVAMGQRAATNQAAKIARGKYVMKVDAHCAFDKGFDRKMLEAYAEIGDDNITMIPLMKNLHMFDWICPEGHRRYQGLSGGCNWIFKDNQWVYCEKGSSEQNKYPVCGKPTTKDVVWIAKRSPNSFTFRFDKTMHFQYFGELAKRPENIKGVLTKNGTYNERYRETMSIQGSCFMCTKEKYFELDLCSEEFHSWGQQGVEVACKTWMSGGRVISNLNTWYAHCFRTKGGDFGFPYPNPESLVKENREISRELFQRNKWPKAIHNFQWLLDKFNPPEWGTITKGIIYYTDNQLDEKIAKPVRDRLNKISEEKKIPITCSSLKRMDFGTRQVRFPSMTRGYLAMFKQILGALEKSTEDIIFFTEHDVLYDFSHFDFVPPDKETFYYNQNVWLLRLPDGHALHYDVNQLSGMCGWRDALIKHFRERYETTLAEYERLKQLYPKEDEFEHEFNHYVRNLGFEPFTHNRVQWKNVFKYDTWKSPFPNIDIKHGANATGQRWKKEEYRNQHLLINWTESENWQIEGWDSKELQNTLI